MLIVFIQRKLQREFVEHTRLIILKTNLKSMKSSILIGFNQKAQKYPFTLNRKNNFLTNNKFARDLVVDSTT